MQLNKEQLDLLSKYFSDISKILVATTVIAFFIPSGQGLITLPVFLAGSFSAVTCLLFSIQITRNII